MCLCFFLSWKKAVCLLCLLSFTWALILFIQYVIKGSILRIRLPLQRHKDQEVLPREELPSQLPPHSNNAPVEQPVRFPLQKTSPPEVSLSETLSLQRNKDSAVLTKEEQLCRLPLQRTKRPEVLTKEPCRLPLQRTKQLEVLPKEEQPCKLPLKTQKEPPVLPQEKQPSLKRQKDQEILPKEKRTCVSSKDQGSRSIT